MGKEFYKNVFYMYVAKLAALIYPVIIIPIFSRLYSTDDFGILMYGVSLTNWLSILLNYGFILYASRAIAKSKERSEINSIIYDVIFAKIILIALLFIILLSFNSLFDFEYIDDLYVYSIFFGAVSIGINPIWYFQGVEDLKSISFYEIVIFVFTMLMVLIIYRLGISVSLSLLLFNTPRLIIYSFLNFKLISNITNTSFSIQRVINLFKYSRHLFFYRLAVSFYTTGNVVILGVFVSPSTVAIYSTAERLISTFVGATSPITQSLYPRINKAMLINRRLAERYTYITILLMFFLGVLGTIVINLYSDTIVKLMLDKNFNIKQASDLLSVLSITLPIMLVNIVIGVQYLLPHDKDSLFNNITIAAGMINLILIYFLVPRFEVFGMAFSVILAELFVLVCFSCFMLRNRF